MFFCSAAIYAQDGVEVSNDFMIISTDTTSEFGQPVVKRRVIVPEKSLIFNLGYGVPFMFNELTNTGFWNKEMGAAFHFEAGFRKQFQTDRTEDGEIIQVPTLWAFGLGLSVNYYSQSAHFDNYAENLPGFIDADGDICDVNLSYNNVEEKVSQLYIDLPLYFEIGKLNQVKTSAFFNMGVKASLLISSSVSGNGTWTSDGYYPEWDVILDGSQSGIPPLDYYTNVPCYNNPQYKLSPFVLWGTLAGGVNIPFSSLEKNRVSNFLLRIGAKAEYSLTKVSKANTDSYYFNNADYRVNQINMLGGKGSRMLLVGLELGLIYCL